ncbi:MAG: penicillin acylase family protein, partial [Candidatus Hydrogenedentes bacterium]|nr:penicillin acylase family protein [Candidatus Hydrogenedentota bacterium]
MKAFGSVRDYLGVLALAALVAFVAVACGSEDRSAFIPPAGKYDARILRDEWGIPHIFGKTDADAAYGLGFAHSEDDWVNMQEAILLERGRLAAVKGKESALFDYMGQLFRIHEFVDEKYEKEIPADTRKVVEAYADGITHYAALHPDKMPHVELPVTGKDIVAGATLKSPFFYEMHHDLQKLFAGDGGVPISASGIMAWADFPEKNPFAPEGNIGSNAWAVAPSRSADGATRLAINSHMPWVGQVTWYEAHLHSEEGWNMIGGTFPGG